MNGSVMPIVIDKCEYSKLSYDHPRAHEGYFFNFLNHLMTKKMPLAKECKGAEAEVRF